MPNWCNQQLSVIGDWEEVQRFTDSIKVNDEYSLNHLYPTPEGLVGTTAGFWTKEPNPAWAERVIRGEMTEEHYKQLVADNEEGYKADMRNMLEYGYKNWYDWNNANWGTKWGACDVHSFENWKISDVLMGMSIKFQSAWSPADKLIQNISQQFPTLIFSVKFTEEGMGFAGVGVFRNGVIIGDAEVEIDNYDNPHEFGSLEWEEYEIEYHDRVHDDLESTENSLLMSI